MQEDIGQIDQCARGVAAAPSARIPTVDGACFALTWQLCDSTAFGRDPAQLLVEAKPCVQVTNKCESCAPYDTHLRWRASKPSKASKLVKLVKLLKPKTRGAGAKRFRALACMRRLELAGVKSRVPGVLVGDGELVKLVRLVKLVKLVELAKLVTRARLVERHVARSVGCLGRR